MCADNDIIILIEMGTGADEQIQSLACVQQSQPTSRKQSLVDLSQGRNARSQQAENTRQTQVTEAAFSVQQLTAADSGHQGY